MYQESDPDRRAKQIEYSISRTETSQLVEFDIQVDATFASTGWKGEQLPKKTTVMVLQVWKDGTIT